MNECRPQKDERVEETSAHDISCQLNLYFQHQFESAVYKNRWKKKI